MIFFYEIFINIVAYGDDILKKTQHLKKKTYEI